MGAAGVGPVALRFDPGPDRRRRPHPEPDRRRRVREVARSSSVRLLHRLRRRNPRDPAHARRRAAAITPSPRGSAASPSRSRAQFLLPPNPQCRLLGLPDAQGRGDDRDRARPLPRRADAPRQRHARELPRLEAAIPSATGDTSPGRTLCTAPGSLCRSRDCRSAARLF